MALEKCGTAYDGAPSHARGAGMGGPPSRRRSRRGGPPMHQVLLPAPSPGRSQTSSAAPDAGSKRIGERSPNMRGSSGSPVRS